MMKSRFYWTLSLGVVLVAGATATAGAQVKKSEEASPRPAVAGSIRSDPERATDSARTYAAGALRFESSWGNVSIIRGADGPVVGTLGWFREFDLTQLLASSPPAVADGRAFQANNFRGSLVG